MDFSCLYLACQSVANRSQIDMKPTLLKNKIEAKTLCIFINLQDYLEIVDDIHTYIFHTLPTGLPNVRYPGIAWVMFNKNQGSKSALSGKLSYTITTTKVSRWHLATKKSDKKPSSGIHLSGSMNVFKYVPPKKMIYPLTGLQFTMVYQDEQKLPNSYLASLHSFTATNHSTSLCHLFVAPTFEENHPKLRRTEPISHSSSLSQTSKVRSQRLTAWVEINRPPQVERGKGVG